MDTRVAPHEHWYRYGVAVLLFEIAVAIAVSGYSLYMSFNGLGGFPGKHYRRWEPIALVVAASAEQAIDARADYRPYRCAAADMLAEMLR